MATLKKPDWDALDRRFRHEGFIANDPISFPHRYTALGDWRVVECSAFLASLLSYGQRAQIIKIVASLLKPLGDNPVETLCETSDKQLQRWYDKLYYRFNTATDFCFLARRLGEVYREEGSLKALWQKANKKKADAPIQRHHFHQALLYGGSIQAPETYGMRFMFADPLKHSAAKRLNMFLRWVVRHDAIDLGIWQDVVSPADLIMPLDTHVAKTARRYKLTQRNSNDWRTAEEITAYFRTQCPEDPVRYDFALFGLGLDS